MLESNETVIQEKLFVQALQIYFIEIKEGFYANAMLDNGWQIQRFGTTASAALRRLNADIDSGKFLGFSAEEIWTTHQ